MAENSNNNRISIRATSEIINYLEQLAKIGIHGKNKTEVAKTLISTEIERLIREGIISLSEKK